jgi:N-acetylmuramoyl-L-alanine amidase
MRTIAALVLAFLACVAPAGAAASLQGDVIVVDPGHGTRFADGSPLNVGAVGIGGLQEQNVVLDVAEDLASLLRAAGARVVLTRSHAVPYRVGSDKRLDNRSRAALANRLQATAFVAIHADASLVRASHGTSVFWLRPNSVKLANAVRARLAPLGLGESAFHRRDLAVTNEARVPAVLVEIGFVTNPREARLLGDPQFRRREAQALFNAIADTFAR